jgi:rhodanese-related sulfurtransferase
MAKRSLFLLPCLLAILSLNGCDGERKRADAPPAAKPQEWSTEDTRSLLADFLKSLPADWNLVPAQVVAKAKPSLVDVRLPEEYAKGSIEGAVNIPLRKLAASLPSRLPLDREIVLVSQNGFHSAVGMAALQMLGYKKTKSLEGGMQAWQDAKLPVVTVAPPPFPARTAGQASEVDARRQAMLDYYLTHTLPFNWGTMTPEVLTDDQHRKSSVELDPYADSFDQGRSALVNVDEEEEFAKAGLSRAINAPLRELPDRLDKMPMMEMMQWA